TTPTKEPSCIYSNISRMTTCQSIFNRCRNSSTTWPTILQQRCQKAPKRRSLFANSWKLKTRPYGHWPSTERNNHGEPYYQIRKQTLPHLHRSRCRHAGRDCCHADHDGHVHRG